MSFWMFSFQAALIGATVFLITPRHVLLQLQIIVWTIGVIAIAWFYGVVDQVLFYSNDQIHYSWVVRILRDWNWMSETSVDGAKLPFTLAGLPLALVGVNETLALKTVSLICLLTLSWQLLARVRGEGLRQQSKMLYISGCGLIGSFFSLLALRETMMMLFAYNFVAARSTAVRCVSLIMLALLRPHLAGALLAAELLMLAWNALGFNRYKGFGTAPALILLGVLVGNLIFITQLRNATKMDLPLFYQWGLTEASRIASNFVGLQFLMVERVNFSIPTLVFLRFILSETVIIPAIFTLLVLFMGRHTSHRNRLTLLTFTIYVSIATNTDFNSFRQNIPLMPLMGLAIMELSSARFNRKQSNQLALRSPKVHAFETSELATAPRGT